jgi:hypothetical protein
MDLDDDIFSQEELCEVAGIDAVTANSWVLRGVIHPGQSGRRRIRGRRTFSGREVFRATLTRLLNTSIGIPVVPGGIVAHIELARWIFVSQRAHQLGNEAFALYGKDRQGPIEFLCREKPGPMFRMAKNGKPDRTATVSLDVMTVVIPISDIIRRAAEHCEKILAKDKNQ